MEEATFVPSAPPFISWWYPVPSLCGHCLQALGTPSSPTVLLSGYCDEEWIFFFQTKLVSFLASKKLYFIVEAASDTNIHSLKNWELMIHFEIFSESPSLTFRTQRKAEMKGCLYSEVVKHHMMVALRNVAKSPIL